MGIAFLHKLLGRLHYYTILTLIIHTWIWQMPNSNSDSDLNFARFIISD